MIAQFGQHSRGTGAGDFTDRGGRACLYLVGQGVDLAQLGDHGVGQTTAALGTGIIIDVDAAQFSRKAFRCSVGVQSDMCVVGSGIGGEDGGGGCHFRCVAGVDNARSGQIGFHRVGNQVHIIFFAARAVIEQVKLLCAGR